MKVLKILGIILLIAVFSAVGYFFYFKSSHTPSYSGEISVPGISQKTEVYYTEHGIPHIYSENEEDAYFAFGYVHAQDRLWQMDLLRHVGSGRLSELFGNDLVEVDKFLRTMGLAEYARKSVKDYTSRNHEALPLIKAYIAGINAYIESNPKTVEHSILRLDVAPFTIENAFEVLTYMAFSFSNAYKTDPFLTELSARLDSQYIEDLKMYHYKGETTIKNFDSRFSSLSDKTIALMNKVNVPEFIGSNSWVLSADKTTTGNVILANDPHIGYAQPSVWYEAHINTPDKEYYGYHVAGCPFPLVMHNSSYANGLTMFENDDVDFYVEEIHPEDSNKYRYKGEWAEISNRKEVIKVNGGENTEVIVRSTVHGPVVSDILKEEPLEEIVSMYWVTTNYENYMMEALYGFLNIDNLEDFEKATSLIHGPGLNVMYGDAKGNVAWWATGKLIKRRDERTSKTFYDGSTGLDDPDSTYAFEKNPHAINPDWGYVYSANNQPDTVDGIVYSGYYLPDDRGERIENIIESKDRFSVEDVKKMMLDSKSTLFSKIKGVMLHTVKDTGESELLRELLAWDETFDRNDFRPVVFQHWLYKIMEYATKDEMGEELWKNFQSTHAYKKSIEPLVSNEHSLWWDNTSTEQKETRSQIIQLAFDDALKTLKEYWGEDFKQWKWGNVHSLTHEHAMGKAISFLNVGPFNVSGGNEVINNLGYTSTGEKVQNITFGPSTRRIVDFSDVRNNSWSILPTGQSGNPFSPYYEDQAEMYANGQFRKMNMNHEKIKESSLKVTLNPAK